MITLFPDQQEALARVLEVYHLKPVGGRARITAPTAWGKTIFFSSLIHALQSALAGKPVLIIAHRDELLDQARDKILMVDPTAIVGKVGGGTHDYGAPITVAGIDTISGARHLKNLHAFGYGLVIVDECHHAPAPKYLKVLEALQDAFRVGVTATDDRLDGQSLDPIFGPAVFKMSIIDAILKKRLSNIKAIATQTEANLDAVKTKKNMDGDIDFSDQELDKAINTPRRNQLVVQKYQEHCSGQRAICFGVTVPHANALAIAFNDAGINAVCVTGATPLPERKVIYAAFDRGEIKVLCNVLVLTEGFDAPKVQCVIMARPTQSRALYIQCIGRGLRLSPGKERCTILDLTDNVLKHRLTPMNLSKAIGLYLRNDETAEDALAREAEEREKAEQEAQVRKLTEKRLKDLQINILESIEWIEHAEGHYSLKLPNLGHTLAILPSKKSPGCYFVAAKISHSPEKQKWSSEQSLEECQVFAEKAALKILADPCSINIYDKTHAWHEKKISEPQKKMLKWYRIEYTDDMSRDEASRLIDTHKAEIERKKAAKAARKAAGERNNAAS